MPPAPGASGGGRREATATIASEGQRHRDELEEGRGVAHREPQRRSAHWRPSAPSHEWHRRSVPDPLGLSDLRSASGVLPNQLLTEAVAAVWIEAGDFRVPDENIQP